MGITTTFIPGLHSLSKLTVTKINQWFNGRILRAECSFESPDTVRIGVNNTGDYKYDVDYANNDVIPHVDAFGEQAGDVYIMGTWNTIGHVYGGFLELIIRLLNMKDERIRAYMPPFAATNALYTVAVDGSLYSTNPPVSASFVCGRSLPVEAPFGVDMRSERSFDVSLIKPYNYQTVILELNKPTSAIIDVDADELYKALVGKRGYNIALTQALCPVTQSFLPQCASPEPLQLPQLLIASGIGLSQPISNTVDERLRIVFMLNGYGAFEGAAKDTEFIEMIQSTVNSAERDHGVLMMSFSSENDRNTRIDVDRVRLSIAPPDIYQHFTDLFTYYDSGLYGESLYSFLGYAIVSSNLLFYLGGLETININTVQQANCFVRAFYRVADENYTWWNSGSSTSDWILLGDLTSGNNSFDITPLTRGQYIQIGLVFGDNVWTHDETNFFVRSITLVNNGSAQVVDQSNAYTFHTQVVEVEASPGVFESRITTDIDANLTTRPIEIWLALPKWQEFPADTVFYFDAFGNCYSDYRMTPETFLAGFVINKSVMFNEGSIANELELAATYIRQEFSEFAAANASSQELTDLGSSWFGITRAPGETDELYARRVVNIVTSGDGTIVSLQRLMKPYSDHVNIVDKYPLGGFFGHTFFGFEEYAFETTGDIITHVTPGFFGDSAAGLLKFWVVVLANAITNDGKTFAFMSELIKNAKIPGSRFELVKI